MQPIDFLFQHCPCLRFVQHNLPYFYRSLSLLDFNISAGIASTLTIFPFFVSDIANKISLIRIDDSISSPYFRLQHANFQLLSFHLYHIYKNSMCCIHLSLTSSDSFKVFSAKSAPFTLLFVLSFFHVGLPSLRSKISPLGKISSEVTRCSL